MFVRNSWDSLGYSYFGSFFIAFFSHVLNKLQQLDFGLRLRNGGTITNCVIDIKGDEKCVDKIKRKWSKTFP